MVGKSDPSASVMKLTSAALTDIGRVRRQNEDRFLKNDDLRLFGVADGVGGLPGGAEAAKLTVETLQAAIADKFPANDTALIRVVREVNNRVAELGQLLSPGLGIGTTLTVGLIHQDILRIAHVGDSRCYLWREGTLHQVTEDHSVENEARARRARGEIVDVPMQHRNALTRCIGQPYDPEVDVVTIPLQAGDRILFASDGITRVLDDPQLAVMLAPPTPPQRCLEEIVHLTNDEGGPDNATAVLIVVDELD